MGLSYEQMLELFKLKENKKLALKKLAKLKPEENYSKEIAELKKNISLGQKATITLIEQNLPLVDFIISTRYNLINMDYEDLQQEGRLGLIKAIDAFDYKLGHQLSTYAQFWIRSYLNQAINNYRHLGISGYSIERLTRVNRYVTNYIVLHGLEPSLQQISEQTNLTIEEIKDLQALPTLISLETPIGGEEDELTLMDTIKDTTILNPNEAYELEIINQELEKAISSLSSVEQKVIRLRYGFDTDIHTLKQTSEIINLSIERVRQIQLEALEKLKLYYKNN